MAVITKIPAIAEKVTKHTSEVCSYVLIDKCHHIGNPVLRVKSVTA
ncbi:unnamed protein product [marine sediment metagenome]|uniref:Uncharacterized protein n=1 Tax=marine sediment metagenome TaxID=412755 RepID=X1G948_9ZZZZ